MRTFGLVGCLSLMLLTGAVSSPAHASILFGLTSGNPGGLYTIDTGTGIATLVQTLTGSYARTSHSGLDYRGGLLYGSSFSGGDPDVRNQFVSIDPVTGLTVGLGEAPGNDFYGLAYDAGADLFYSYHDGFGLHTITPGGVFNIVAPGEDFFDGLAIDPG